MSGSDDPTSDMASSPADRTERLIAGTSAPGSDGEARVVRLLDALRTPTVSDGVHEQEAVSAIVATIAASPTRLVPGRPRMIARIATAKVAAVAGVLLLAGTGAAAATGSLPDAAQGVVSDALAKVHVDVPHPDDHATGPGATDHATGAAVGADATGPAMKGLCTAWAARGKTDDTRGNSGNSTAFSNLRQAAHDQGQFVKEYCAEVLAGSDVTAVPGQAGEDHGQAGEDHGQSGDDQGQSGEDHGQSGDDQGQSGEDHGSSTSTPASGVDQGSTASDGANETGSDHSVPAATAGADHRGSHGTGEHP